jgi:outer membrane protein TolC
MLVLSACSIDTSRPGLGIAIPAQYAASPANPSAALPDLDWWRSFRSAELTSLVERAQAGNFDIAAAIARIAQADAQSRVTGAALFPTVGLDGGASRSRSSARAARCSRAARSAARTPCR